MSNDKVPTPITDKNGKSTVVHKNPVAPVSASRLTTTRLRPAAALQEEELRPSQMTYDQIIEAWAQFRKSKGRWTKNERQTRDTLESLFVYIENPEVDLDEEIPPSKKTFREIRNNANGLHFAKEMLSEDERVMLTYMESLLTKVDRDAGGFVY